MSRTFTVLIIRLTILTRTISSICLFSTILSLVRVCPSLTHTHSPSRCLPGQGRIVGTPPSPAAAILPAFLLPLPFFLYILLFLLSSAARWILQHREQLIFVSACFLFFFLSESKKTYGLLYFPLMIKEKWFTFSHFLFYLQSTNITSFFQINPFNIDRYFLYILLVDSGYNYNNNTFFFIFFPLLFLCCW